MSKGLLFVLITFALTLGACSSNNSPGEKPNENVLMTAVCEDRMRARFDELEVEQTNWYKAHTSAVVDPSQRARFSIGSNGRAVLVVHGFISSPAYMHDVVDGLVAAGFTVYAPLMTGFGADATAANSATADDWRRSIEEGVKLLNTCHPGVEVVAHSLGAALITDGIQNRALGPMISKLVLLAPYFRANGAWPGIIAKLLNTRVDVVDLDTFRRLTFGLDPYEYLPITRPLPGAPEPFLPIPALSRVLEIQDGFTAPARQMLPQPSYVVFSEADDVVDTSFAVTYVTTNFTAPRTLVYEAGARIGHSMQLRQYNPRFDALMAELLSFL